MNNKKLQTIESVFFLILLLGMASCSSLKKTLIYSSMSGALVGASSGAAFSPNKESRGANAVVFGLVGAGLAGLIGYGLYQEDPRNYELKEMLREKRPQKKEIPKEEFSIDLGGMAIKAEFQQKEAYKLPLKDLPKELDGKIGRQHLIKYQSKERVIQHQGTTYYIPAFEVFEHSYGDLPKGD